MSEQDASVLDTENPPSQPAERIGDTKPGLLLSEDHDLCAGCGEPLALRMMLEAIEDLGCSESTIGVVGIGCYTALTSIMDLDLVQALHGRAPSIATGAKRMRPKQLIFTLQGDGDMVNEGLQEVIHSAARGESITCVLINNGVFGETGGHMTATTALGQRTKNTIEGRDADYHGHPILISEMLAPLGGVSYVARCGVYNAAEVSRTKRMLKKAFQTQLDGKGFSFIEILTMCPTGWFIPTAEGPDYLNEVLAPVHRLRELKVDGVLTEIDSDKEIALANQSKS